MTVPPRDSAWLLLVDDAVRRIFPVDGEAAIAATAMKEVLVDFAPFDDDEFAAVVSPLWEGDVKAGLAVVTDDISRFFRVSERGVLLVIPDVSRLLRPSDTPLRNVSKLSSRSRFFSIVNKSVALLIEEGIPKSPEAAPCGGKWK